MNAETGTGPAPARTLNSQEKIAPQHSLRADLWELAKPRLTGLVVVTTAVGYWLAHPPAQSFLLRPWLATLCGTALVSAAASVLNQWYERDHDREMTRTRGRPIASGRVTGFTAATYALLTGFGGLSLICLEANPLASGLALTTLLVYVAIYTPLKRKHSLNTIVGAIPGAIPPLIGWAAASGQLTPAAWSLFLILFLWQIPHFLAIAVLYRDDYENAGYLMLPVRDPKSTRTAKMALLYSVVLVPASVFPAVIGLGGTVYAIAACILSLAFFHCALRFERDPSRDNARALFLASIAYLPTLLIFLCANSLPQVGR